MFNQKFAVTIVYGDGTNVSTDDVRTWIKDRLEGKVKNARFTVDTFSSSSYGRTFEGQIFVRNEENIAAETLKRYIDTSLEANFRFEKIEKV